MDGVSEAAPTPWDDYDPRALVGTGAHLSKDELWVWTRVVQASRLLEEVLARQLSQDHGMTHSDYEVLVLLDSAGGQRPDMGVGDNGGGARGSQFRHDRSLVDRGLVQ